MKEERKCQFCFQFLPTRNIGELLHVCLGTFLFLILLIDFYKKKHFQGSDLEMLVGMIY